MPEPTTLFTCRHCGQPVTSSDLAEAWGGQIVSVPADNEVSGKGSAFFTVLCGIHHLLRVLLERERAAEARYAEGMQPLRRTPSEARSQGPAASEGPLPSPSCTTPGPGPSEE